MFLRLASFALLFSAAAPLFAQCPFVPLPIAIEKTDVLGNPDSSFVEAGRDVAIAPGRVALSALGEFLAPFQSPTPFKGAVWILAPDTSGAWNVEAKLRGTYVSTSTFGFRIEFAGPDTLVVGNPGNCPLDCVETGPTGSAHVFDRGAGGWSETQVLAAPMPFENDSFGVSLAADGDLLAIGAPGNPTFTPGQTSSVHVFERTASGWQHRAQVLPPGPSSQFGVEIDLAAGLLVVSDPSQPVSTGFHGAVHVFRMGTGPDTWMHATTLSRAAHDDNFSRFGACVATDGNRIAVGVPGAHLSIDPFAALATEPGAVQSGRVDVFEDRGSGFARVAAVAPPEPEIGARFGSSVALDGPRLVVGTPFATGDPAGGPPGMQTGIVFAFELHKGRWAPTDVLKGTTLDGVNPVQAGARIGSIVELHGDRVILAAPNASFPGTPERGAAALFELNGSPCDPRKLLGAPGLVSVALGGEHVWSIRGGSAAAGGTYLVLGSASGTEPGAVVDGVPIPLNPDPYLFTTLAFVNRLPFAATLGVLDGTGGGSAALMLPAGTSPSLVGIELFHAALLFDASFLLTGATEAARVALVP